MTARPAPPDRSLLAEEVHRWVGATWRDDLTVREWWRLLACAGYSYPSWPVGAGGRASSFGDARTITSALAGHPVLAPPVGHVAATLAAPTIIEHGTPAQVAELVFPIALGETAWCQLFSEPGSGSDLASLGARADRDGDEWVVTGQKVWNSGADTADLGMLLARTDLDAPKHRGITYFAIDMHQPGVDVRPLRQMNGQSSFCEVFLTDVRVPVDRVIGEVGGGWRVAQTTLTHERSSVSAVGVTGLVSARSGPLGGDLDLAVGEVIDRAHRSAQRRQSPLRSGAVPSKVMLELARDYRVDRDPVIRQELAKYLSQVRVNAWTTRRIGAAQGRLTGADGSLVKLATSRICQHSRDLSYAIVGADALLDGAEAPMGGDLQRTELASPGTRIGGGTDEIQLDVLGERALGLPREPFDDRDVPYRNLSVGARFIGS